MSRGIDNYSEILIYQPAKDFHVIPKGILEVFLILSTINISFLRN